MGRLYILILLLPLFISCSDDEPLGPREILISNEWVSEKFIFQGIMYDSLIVHGMVTDTIERYEDDIYPGDVLRADSWMELTFNETFYWSYLMNNSYKKCVYCSDYIHIALNTFPFSGKYFLVNSNLETEKLVEGQWIPDLTYVIEFMEKDRIKIYNWLRFPVLSDDPELTITSINNVKVEPGNNLFDVVFRKK